MMTGTELFCKAHEIARKTRDSFVTYRAAFSAALKGVYAMMKSEKNEYIARYEAAVAKAEADADTLKVDEFSRGQYVRMAVREALGAYDMLWDKIKSRMEWDTAWTKEGRIFTIICLMHSPMYDGIESIPADASPRKLARKAAYAEMTAALNDLMAA